MYTLTQQIAAWILPVLLAITLHEASHAFVAHLCGDSTAKRLGRLSINPAHHMDLVGTILVPILMAIISHFHFIFGWAKPVPIDWSKFRHARISMAMVAIAGPLANVLMCFIWALCFKLSLSLHPQQSTLAAFLMLSSKAGIFINLILGLLNLLPIPPLDGSRIVASLLPPKSAIYYLSIEPFGFIILILLMLSGVLGWIINPLFQGALALLHTLLGI